MRYCEGEPRISDARSERERNEEPKYEAKKDHYAFQVNSDEQLRQQETKS